MLQPKTNNFWSLKIWNCLIVFFLQRISILLDIYSSVFIQHQVDFVKTVIAFEQSVTIPSLNHSSLNKLGVCWSCMWRLWQSEKSEKTPVVPCPWHSLLNFPPLCRSTGNQCLSGWSENSCLSENNRKIIVEMQHASFHILVFEEINLQRKIFFNVFWVSP